MGMIRKNIYLPEKLIEKAEELAKEKGISSVSEVIRRALEEYLEKREKEAE